MGPFTDWLQTQTGVTPELQSKLLTTVLTVVILWAIRLVILRVVQARERDLQRVFRWQRVTAYVMAGLGFLMIGRIWLASFQALTTVLGLGTAGLAIALRDPVVNLAGWFFIVTRRPFTVGDRIEVGASRGDVVNQQLFQFSMMEIGNWADGDDRTGRLLWVPNGVVFTQTIASYNGGWFEYIWNEIPILLTFESNWEAAKILLLDVADRHCEHVSRDVEKDLRRRASDMLVFDNLELKPVVYVAVKDSGVELTIRYLCRPFRRRATEELIWEDVLREFGRREDVDFAYPTQRFYNNALEGKRGARAYIPGPQSHAPRYAPPPEPDPEPDSTTDVGKRPDVDDNPPAAATTTKGERSAV